MLKNLEKQEVTLNQNSAQLFLNKNYEELNEEELLTLQGYLDERMDQQEPGYNDLPDDQRTKTSQYTAPLWQGNPNMIFSPYAAALLIILLDENN